MKPAILFVAILALSACTPDDVRTLPEGVQSVSGVVEQAKISLDRRGSHVLLQDDVPHAYLESTRVNLRAYESQQVTLSGSYQANTHPDDLPVIVVQAITSAEETMKEWVVPGLGLSVEAPIHWTRQADGAATEFMVPGISQPVLRISEAPLPPEDDRPDGASVVLDGYPGVRVSDFAAKTDIVHVFRDATMVTFEWNVQAAEAVQLEAEAWGKILQSIEFSTPAPPPSSIPSSAAPGAACGGPAGILCPSGQYCEITDRELGIGKCRGI